MQFEFRGHSLLGQLLMLMALLAAPFAAIADTSPAASNTQIYTADTNGVRVEIVQLSLDGRAALMPVGVGGERITEQLDSHVVERAGTLVLLGKKIIRVAPAESAGRAGAAVFQQITISVPRHRLSMSWDVKALERELRRLGIKVKPAPGSAEPKPAPPVAAGV